MGHSIGGLWAAEYCLDLDKASAWPDTPLSFFYMGVHGRGVSLAPFRHLPFSSVGWSCASEDVTMQRAALGNVTSYLAQVREELPDKTLVVEIAGGNHEQYGCYGSPGPWQGLAYKDLPALISAEEQQSVIAAAVAAITFPPAATATATAVATGR